MSLIIKSTIMRNLSLLFILTLFLGCEKYELVSEPNLTGGKWTLSDYRITLISAISGVTMVENDTICINNFALMSYGSNGEIILSQDYNSTSIDRRFIVGKTQWEFDDNNRSLYCDFDDTGYPTHNPLQVTFDCYLCDEYTSLDVLNNGGRTNWTFDTESETMMYPRKLTLLSPKITTDLLLEDGSRDKAVTVQVKLTFLRN